MDKMTEAATIVRELRKVSIRAGALEQQKRDLVTRLLALGWESGKHETTAGPFTVSAVNEYPQSALRAGLTGGQARLCQKPVTLDPAKVKALYPAVYAAAKVEKGQKVTL